MYTLIKISDDHRSAKPSTNGQNAQDSKPEIKRVVMGDDIQAGETMILTVPPGWWKRSETLSPDGHCLISETVTPAWVPDDHAFMSPGDLERICGGTDNELHKESVLHVLPEGHELDFA